MKIQGRYLYCHSASACCYILSSQVHTISLLSMQAWCDCMNKHACDCMYYNIGSENVPLTVWYEVLDTIYKTVSSLFFNIAIHFSLLDLSSSCIQMAALGHTSTPLCFVVHQFLGFFPSQVHILDTSNKILLSKIDIIQ